MIDTAIKDGRHLLEHWGLLQLNCFIEEVTRYDMLCGLAGALRYEDIGELQSLGADYLGFRSALCKNQERTTILQVELAEEIQRAMLNSEGRKGCQLHE